jgi:hypothetical protein
LIQVAAQDPEVSEFISTVFPVLRPTVDGKRNQDADNNEHQFRDKPHPMTVQQSIRHATCSGE